MHVHVHVHVYVYVYGMHIAYAHAYRMCMTSVLHTCSCAHAHVAHSLLHHISIACDFLWSRLPAISVPSSVAPTRAVSTIECEARIRASRRSPIDPSSALAANVRFAPASLKRVGSCASSNFFPCRSTPHRHDRTRNGVRSPREHRRLRGADGFDAASRPRSLSSNCTVCTDRERRPERPASNCPGSSDREHGRASRLRVREGS